MRNAYPQRNVSDAGQVFFESADALVPRATNRKLNVYEYVSGQPYLLSRGMSEADSYFLDASPDGSNVFLATAQSLLERNDVDAVYDIYDARVNGGFAEPAGASPSCTDETSCLGAVVSVPVFSAPASATFQGVGNFLPPIPTKPKPIPKLSKCKKGRVRTKSGGCRKVTSRRSRHKSKSHKGERR